MSESDPRNPRNPDPRNPDHPRNDPRDAGSDTPAARDPNAHPPAPQPPAPQPPAPQPPTPPADVSPPPAETAPPAAPPPAPDPVSPPPAASPPAASSAPAQPAPPEPPAQQPTTTAEQPPAASPPAGAADAADEHPESQLVAKRRWGRLLRGRASSIQLLITTTVAVALGLTPLQPTAPGAFALLAIVLLLFNTNLLIAVPLVGLGLLAGEAIAPALFDIGYWMIHSPGFREPIRWAVNAPVFAWLGLEYYAVTGGLAVGLLVGLLIGVVLVVLAKESDRRFMKRQTRRVELAQRDGGALGWLLVGRDKRDRVLDRFAGSPIRPAGVALVLLLLVAGVVIRYAYAEQALAWGLERQLTQANGATVEVESTELAIEEGAMAIEGLAMTDPANLNYDLLRAPLFAADVNTADLLRRRVRVDRLVALQPRHQVERATPGQRFGPPPEPPPALPDEPTLDDYVVQADLWIERLRQARRWLEQVMAEAEPLPDETPEQTAEREYREAVEAARIAGYATVFDAELIEAAPSVRVDELVIDQLETPYLGGETLTVKGFNLSSQPDLVPEPARVELASSNGSITGLLEIDMSSAQGVPPGRVAFRYMGMPGDWVGQQLKVEGLDAAPLQGGSVDLALEGSLNGANVDLVAVATLTGTQLVIPQLGPIQISEPMEIPIAIRGPIDRPRIDFSLDLVADALMSIGKAELANQLRARTDEAAQRAASLVRDKLQSQLGEALGDDLGGEIGRELGDIVGEEIESGAGGLLNNLLGGRRGDSADAPEADDGGGEGDVPEDAIGRPGRDGEAGGADAEEPDTRDRLEDAARRGLGGLLNRQRDRNTDRDPDTESYDPGAGDDAQP